MRVRQGLFTIFAVLGAIASGVGGAHAQQPYNWSGIYIGATAGYSWNHVNWDYFGLPGQSIRRTYDTFTPGGIAGAQMQFGQLVLGVELGMQGSRETGVGPDAPIFAAAFDSSVHLSSTLSVGPRVGWALNNWLFYGTGGYSKSQIITEFYAKGFPTVTARFNSYQDGWYYGGGIEYAVTKSVILGFEYRHLETERFLQKSTAIPAVGSAHFVDASAEEVKARLSFKLGPQ